MRDIANAAAKLLEIKQDFVLATIVKSFGSTPRREGARMILRRDGTMVGTIGGGALEAKVCKIALDVMENKKGMLMPFNLTAEDSARLGMTCGGEGSVFVDYVSADHQATMLFFNELVDAIENGDRVRLVTFLPSVRTGPIGSYCLLKSDGTIVGISEHNAHLREILCNQVKHHHTFTILEQHGAIIEPVGYSGTALILGAGHIAKSLTPLLSSLEFRTVIIDDRKEFANSERFGRVDEIVLLDSFDNAFHALKIDRETYIIIITRGHLHDQTVLKQSLGTNAAYIGMIGSRTKRDHIYQNLLREGFTKTELEKIHAPIGLPIRAETPAEISVSIAAELIKARADLKG